MSKTVKKNNDRDKSLRRKMTMGRGKDSRMTSRMELSKIRQLLSVDSVIDGEASTLDLLYELDFRQFSAGE